MRQLWQQLDQLLRRQESALADDALHDVRASYLAVGIVLLAGIYGFFMGWYAIFSRAAPEWRQVAADTWKMPTLFLMTLVICFPSLYVFSALLGSRLSFAQMLRVLLAIVAITATVLASFGPIVGFFALSTENHPFMVLLNVAFCAVAGLLGVGVLWKALRILLAPKVEAAAATNFPPMIQPPSPTQSDRQVKSLFRVWILIYAVVGSQMGWVLRPSFISDPEGAVHVVLRQTGEFLPAACGMHLSVCSRDAMASLFATVDEFLRVEGMFAREGAERRRFWAQLRMVGVCAALYGAVMGSFHGLGGDGWKQIVLSAAKVPLLFLATFALCFPSFYVLNALAGLRDDFPRVVNAVLGFQSLTAIVLAALAQQLPSSPESVDNGVLVHVVVEWAHVCGGDHLRSVENERSLYRPLIASNSRHRPLAFGWIILYWFVGIQMAWVLRPFVGSPGMPIQFLRPHAWGNAYVKVAEIVLRVLRR